MEQKNNLTILSTFAKDMFIDEMSGTVREQEGGPAFYLTKAFTLEGVLFDLRSTSIVEVEILIKQDGEFGKIAREPDLLTVGFADVESQFLVISTLLDEIKLEGIRAFKGKVFLDIQGYVRDGTDFGKKRQWNPSQEIVDSIFCLKGTSEELQHISDSFLAKQKEKMLIETRGEQGCVIFFGGKSITIWPSHIVSSTNAVGAGDTFFAYFISQYMRNEDAQKSCEYAVEKTAEFLMTKIPDLHNWSRDTQAVM
jgi:hypothetical protein